MSRLSWLFIISLGLLYVNLELEYDGTLPTAFALILFVSCIVVPFWNYKRWEEEQDPWN